MEIDKQDVSGYIRTDPKNRFLDTEGEKSRDGDAISKENQEKLENAPSELYKKRTNWVSLALCPSDIVIQFSLENYNI